MTRCVGSAVGTLGCNRDVAARKGLCKLCWWCIHLDQSESPSDFDNIKDGLILARSDDLHNTSPADVQCDQVWFL